MFRDKKALFLATQDRVQNAIRAALTEAWRTATPDESPAITLERCHTLLTNPDTLRCQLLGYAAAAAYPHIREHMRRGSAQIFDLIQHLTEADEGPLPA